ncbi:hypothetical protein J4464_01740 [Candidatus Woesearchaeota archaeon]|nr:hypothetical protein [Candidatus Woesearchaeota archaeon]
MKVSFAYTEAAIVVVFCCVFLISGLGSPWAHTLRHDFPYGYGASDAFFHQSVTEYMKEQGRVKYTPPYEVGGYDNVYDAHPPILFQIAAPLSIMTGIETYDTVLFTAVFLLLLSGLVMYCIIRAHSTSIALLALPVTLLMLGGKSLIALKWGYWLFIAGVFFMLAAFWMLSKRDVKHSWVLLGLLLGATAVAHIPEFVFLGIFMALMLLWEVYKHKKLPIATLKTFIIAGVLAVILAARNWELPL